MLFPPGRAGGGAGPHCRVAGSYAWLRSAHGRCIGARAEAEAKIREYDGARRAYLPGSKEARAAESALADAAHALAEARGRVVPRFIDAVQAQMARLEMKGARLEANISDLPRGQWDTWGSQSFEFLFAAGEGLSAQRGSAKLPRVAK